MPDTIFVSLSNFHNSRWPPRWPPIVYVHRNDPRTLTLCTILMNFGSFSRVSMMLNPMSMVPITSNVNIKVIGNVVGVYNPILFVKVAFTILAVTFWFML